METDVCVCVTACCMYHALFAYVYMSVTCAMFHVCFHLCVCVCVCVCVMQWELWCSRLGPAPATLCRHMSQTAPTASGHATSSLSSSSSLLCLSFLRLSR